MSVAIGNRRTRLAHKIEELLVPEEMVVWIGNPGSVFSTRKYNLFYSVYLGISLPSLLICFLVQSLSPVPTAVPNILFVVPVVTIGLTFVASAIADYLIRRNTIYVMTDKRAIFLSDWPKRWLLEVDLGHHPTITKVVHTNGQGTVSFAGQHDDWLFQLLGAESFLLNPWLLKEPVFFDVDAAEDVYLEAQFLSLHQQNMPTKAGSKIVPVSQFLTSLIAASFVPCLFIAQIIGVIGILGMKGDGF